MYKAYTYEFDGTEVSATSESEEAAINDLKSKLPGNGKDYEIKTEEITI